MCLMAEELENRGIQKGIQSVARNKFLSNMSEETTAAICKESPMLLDCFFSQEDEPSE